MRFRFLRVQLSGMLATRSDALLPRMVRVIEDLAGDWSRLDEQIEGLSCKIETLARRDAGCERLMSVPGIGRSSPAREWQRSALEMRPQRPRLRRLAGLVPKQISTRNRTILGEISKRGNRYLRTIRAGGLGRHPLGSKLIDPTRPCDKGGRITDWQGFPSIFCRGSASAHLISLDLRSSARKWVGVFGNGALHISAHRRSYQLDLELTCPASAQPATA